MNQISKNSNLCKLNYCNVPKYKDNDVCILHNSSFDKDRDEFFKALDIYMQNKKWDFIGIYFPYRLVINEIPEEDIRFLACRFNDEFTLSKKEFKHKFIFDSCHFFYSVSLHKCIFNDFTLFRGNKFYASFSLISSVFNEKTVFYFNEFKHGINLHKIAFDKNKGFIFRNSEMGASFLYESDIQNISFILCNWDKKYLLAEEIYDLKLNTRFGLMGVTNNYFNKLMTFFNRWFSKNDFLIKLLYRKEYNRQKELSKKNSSIYITHTGWNDCEMAEDTYRKLRLRYSKQGEPEISGNFYFREKVSQRRRQKNIKRIIDYFLKEFSIGYGEKPFRVLRNSILLIVAFSGIYYYSGLLQFKDNSIVNDFLTSIYFSIVTFTTLGYGDYYPTDWLKIVSAFEAFLGALMIALFIVTLTRKFIR